MFTISQQTLCDINALTTETWHDAVFYSNTVQRYVRLVFTLTTLKQVMRNLLKVSKLLINSAKLALQVNKNSQVNINWQQHNGCW